MKIPEKITIAGLTVDVLFVDPEEINGNIGECNQSKGYIKLSNAKHIKKDIIEQIFIHELMHIIFDSLYLHEDTEVVINEKLTDNISMFLHQIIVQLT